MVRLACRYFANEPLTTPPARLPKPVSREEEPLQDAPLPSIKILRPAGYPGDEAAASAKPVRSPQPMTASPSGAPPPAKRMHRS